MIKNKLIIKNLQYYKEANIELRVYCKDGSSFVAFVTDIDNTHVKFLSRGDKRNEYKVIISAIDSLTHILIIHTFETINEKGLKEELNIMSEINKREDNV